MEITLVRNTFTESSTIGDLIIDGQPICFILEDYDRKLSGDMGVEAITAAKIYGKTCIPYGRYEVTITYSNRFKKPLPLLMNVKGFDGIRIHAGNTDADTLGCLLTGSAKLFDRVTGSRIAFNKLFSILKAAMKKEKVFINIVRPTVLA